MKLNKQFLEDVAGSVRTAGHIVANYFGKDLQQIAKSEGHATQADLETEQCLINKLTTLFPQAAVLAEESCNQAQQAEYCWVIDPLDGTTNFSRGLPYFAVSVALTKNNWPILGVIYNPVLDELFYGATGLGLYCNGKLLLPLVGRVMGQSLIGISFSYQTADDYKSLWLAAQAVRAQAYSVRQFGSAALDLAHLAAGRIDGVFFKSLHWWDVAAGLCLAEVAGAKISAFDGGKIAQKFDSCVVSAPTIHTQMVSLLKNY